MFRTQSFLKTLTLIAILIKVFRVFQKKPMIAFEHFFPLQGNGIPMEVTPRLRQFVFEGFDDMRIIKYEKRLGNVERLGPTYPIDTSTYWDLA